MNVIFEKKYFDKFILFVFFEEIIFEKVGKRMILNFCILSNFKCL